MDKSIFQFVLRYSKRQQVILVIMAFVSLPFYFLLLNVPKQIVDEALIDDGGSASGAFPKSLLGFEFNQIEFLLALCFLFLVLVIINGGFKYFINVLRRENKLKNIEEPVVYHSIFPPTYYSFIFRTEKMRDDFNFGLKIIRGNGIYQNIIDRYIKY